MTTWVPRVVSTYRQIKLGAGSGCVVNGSGPVRSGMEERQPGETQRGSSELRVLLTSQSTDLR